MEKNNFKLTSPKRKIDFRVCKGHEIEEQIFGKYGHEIEKQISENVEEQFTLDFTEKKN